MELKTIIGEAEKMVMKNKGGNKGNITRLVTTTTHSPRQNRTDLGNNYGTQHLNETSIGLIINITTTNKGLIINKEGNKGNITRLVTTTTNPPRQNRTDLGNNYGTQHLNETSKGLL